MTGLPPSSLCLSFDDFKSLCNVWLPNPPKRIVVLDSETSIGADKTPRFTGILSLDQSGYDEKLLIHEPDLIQAPDACNLQEKIGLLELDSQGIEINPNFETFVKTIIGEPILKVIGEIQKLEKLRKRANSDRKKKEISHLISKRLRWLEGSILLVGHNVLEFDLWTLYHNLDFDEDERASYQKHRKKRHEITHSYQSKDGYLIAEIVQVPRPNNTNLYYLRIRYKNIDLIHSNIDTMKIAQTMKFPKSNLSYLSTLLNQYYFKQKFSYDEVVQRITKEEIEYNRADLYSTLELLLRELKIIDELTKSFNVVDAWNYVQKYSLNKTQYLRRESFKSLIMLFHSSANVAKLIESRIPKGEERLLSPPYFGGRTRFYRRGKVKNVEQWDLNSMYPSIISAVGGLNTWFISDDLHYISELLSDFADNGISAVRYLQIDKTPLDFAIAPASMVTFEAMQDVKLRGIGFGMTKQQKNIENRNIVRYYTNDKRYGYAEFSVCIKKGESFAITVAELLQQKKSVVKDLRAVNCELALVEKDDSSLSQEYRNIYEKRADIKHKIEDAKTEGEKVKLKALSDLHKTALLNTPYGLLADVDQQNASLVRGASISAYGRMANYIICNQDPTVVYTDTDSFAFTGKPSKKAKQLVKLLFPYGWSKEERKSGEYHIFQRKRYIVENNDGLEIVGYQARYPAIRKIDELAKLVAIGKKSERDAIKEIKEIDKKDFVINVSVKKNNYKKGYEYLDFVEQNQVKANDWFYSIKDGSNDKKCGFVKSDLIKSINWNDVLSYHLKIFSDLLKTNKDTLNKRDNFNEIAVSASLLKSQIFMSDKMSLSSKINPLILYKMERCLMDSDIGVKYFGTIRNTNAILYTISSIIAEMNDIYRKGMIQVSGNLYRIGWNQKYMLDRQFKTVEKEPSFITVGIKKFYPFEISVFTNPNRGFDEIYNKNVAHSYSPIDFIKEIYERYEIVKKELKAMFIASIEVLFTQKDEREVRNSKYDDVLYVSMLEIVRDMIEESDIFEELNLFKNDLCYDIPRNKVEGWINKVMTVVDDYNDRVMDHNIVNSNVDKFVEVQDFLDNQKGIIKSKSLRSINQYSIDLRTLPTKNINLQANLIIYDCFKAFLNGVDKWSKTDLKEINISSYDMGRIEIQTFTGRKKLTQKYLRSHIYEIEKAFRAIEDQKIREVMLEILANLKIATIFRMNQISRYDITCNMWVHPAWSSNLQAQCAETARDVVTDSENSVTEGKGPPTLEDF